MPPKGFKTITVKNEYYDEVKDYYLERTCSHNKGNEKDEDKNNE